MENLPDFLINTILGKYKDLKKFAISAGIPYQTMVNMRVKRTLPSLKTFQKICIELNLSANELLGLNDMSFYSTKTKEQLFDDERILMVDMLENKSSCGIGQEVLEKKIKGKIPILERFIYPHKPEEIDVIEVIGDSMIDVGLNDRDLVFYVKGLIRDNGIYAICFGSDCFVKRIILDKVNKKIIIKSENKKYQYPDTVIDDNNPSLLILGKVIGWIHKHSY